jgi:hypothetical protein
MMADILGALELGAIAIVAVVAIVAIVRITRGKGDGESGTD